MHSGTIVTNISKPMRLRFSDDLFDAGNEIVLRKLYGPDR